MNNGLINSTFIFIENYRQCSTPADYCIIRNHSIIITTRFEVPRNEAVCYMSIH